MNLQEASSDILVIHQNRIIFSSGEGPLTQHSKISAQVTQVLSLFSQRIMNGESIHFIRFENHRMIFLFSQTKNIEELVAIVLIPIERSAKQVIPAMSIILRMIEDFLQGNILDAQNRQLDCFYQIISEPRKSLFILPRTSQGVLAALVILTAFAHDIQFGIQQIVSNIQFIDPNNPLEIQKIIEQIKTTKIMSFIHLPDVEKLDNVLIFGLEAPLRQYFSALSGEEIYDVISRIFGERSNAAKMKFFVDNEEAKEIAHSIALLPHSEDDFIRKEILLPTVLQPGKDIVVTMSTPVMQKLRGLASSAKVEDTTKTDSELEKLALELQESDLEEKISVQPESKIEPSPIDDLSAEPDAIPQKILEPVPKTVQIAPQIEISEKVVKSLIKARKSGLEYQFDSLPIIFDTAPFGIELPRNQKLPFDESKISISLFTGDEGQFLIRMYTYVDRLPAIKDSLEDLSVRIGGEIQVREDHILIEGPIEKQRMTIRALLWLSIVEYLTQVEMNIQKLSNRLKIPKEGSILIIPPKRDYVKEKIPSKFKSFIEETTLRRKYEQAAIWTLAKTQDEILSQIMEPLKHGDGVVFVASDENHEMEEIALFLLLISEICGIGFSRW
jgi:hypothetical protein